MVAYLSKFYWPCRVTRDGNGHHHISPFDIVGCDGTGPSLEEASEAARVALLKNLNARRGEIVIPPIVALGKDELRRGEVVRIEIDMTA